MASKSRSCQSDAYFIMIGWMHAGDTQWLGSLVRASNRLVYFARKHIFVPKNPFTSNEQCPSLNPSS